MRRAIASAGQRSPARSLFAIVPLVLLFYSFLLFPPEARLTFAGVNLPLYRLAIILFLPTVPLPFLRGAVRLSVVDGLVLAAAAWMVISFSVFYGFQVGVVRAMGLALDLAGAYLIARATIDSPLALRRVLIVIVPGLVFAGVVMMVESISHQTIYRRLFADLLGDLRSYEGGEAVGVRSRQTFIRLGLMRAYGPFSHSILGGVFLATLLPIWLMSGIRSWPKMAGVAAAVLGIFSVSSAAFLALFLGAGLYIVDRFQRFLTIVRWPVISAAVVAALLFVQLVSENGVVRLMARLTLDPQTAFYRILIWRYGSQSVANNAVFGIGFTPYARLNWMPPTIDAHFLMLGVRHGLLVPLALLAAVTVAMIRLGIATRRFQGVDRNLAVGTNFALFIALISSFTVAYFGEANIWFMALIGIATSLAGAERAMPRATQPAGYRLMSGARGAAAAAPPFGRPGQAARARSGAPASRPAR